MNQVQPSEATQALLTEFDLGSARGGKAGINAPPLTVDIIRPLTTDDLPAIANPPAVAARGTSLQTIRHSHHQIAQLLVEGKPLAEINLVTGYSISRISDMQNDPAFAELVAYYSHQREAIFASAQERLRNLGLDATEKLHEHLHDPTKVWSHRELMEVIKLALPAETSIKQPASNTVNVSAEGGGALEIKFVGARPAESGPMIDVTPGS